MLNEIEPWYLDLQNQDLGQYARTDYTYQAKYQARNIIQMGAEISPKTPFGEYRLLPNTDVNIQAGEAINLKPGVHIQHGARAHLYISPVSYNCNPQNMPLSNTGLDQQRATEPLSLNTLSLGVIENEKKSIQLHIYPNPNKGTFTIQINAPQLNEGWLQVYTLQGQLIDEISVKNNTEVILKQTFSSKTVLLGRLVDKQRGYLIGETKIIIQ